MKSYVLIRNEFSHQLKHPKTSWNSANAGKSGKNAMRHQKICKDISLTAGGFHMSARTLK